MDKIEIEIKGVYDGICVTFEKETKTFNWRGIAIERTTEEYRKQFEQQFLEQWLQQNKEN